MAQAQKPRHEKNNHWDTSTEHEYEGKKKYRLDFDKASMVWDKSINIDDFYPSDLDNVDDILKDVVNLSIFLYCFMMMIGAKVKMRMSLVWAIVMIAIAAGVLAFLLKTAGVI